MGDPVIIEAAINGVARKAENPHVPIEPDDTALALNARCFETAIATFKQLVTRLAQGDLTPQAQDLTQRSYFARHRRPARAGVIDWTRPAGEIAALVRGLDFGVEFTGDHDALGRVHPC